MGHSAALYTVRVKRARKKKDKYVKLGNIDGKGTALADVLYELLPDEETLFAENSTSTRMAWFEEAQLKGADGGDAAELMVWFQHGRSGESATLTEEGEVVFKQRHDHEHQVPCALLLRLPPDQETGWLAAHVNNGRSVYSLIAKTLYGQFREKFKDEKLLLELNPWVRVSALEQALAENRLDEIRLIKDERPANDAVGATNRWVMSNRVGRLEVAYSAKNAFLNADLVKRFLKGTEEEKAALREDILEFHGMQFDKAMVVVELEDEKRKTYNIEKPSAGHVFTIEMDSIQTDDEGHPTDSSLFRGLRDALGQVD